MKESEKNQLNDQLVNNEQQSSSESHDHNPCDCKKELNYIIPAAIVIAGLLIAMSILAGNASPDVNVANQRMVTESNDSLILNQLDVPESEVLACAEQGQYDELINAHITQAVTSGGQGTPWTVVYDRQTNNYYPLNGAVPAGQIYQLLDSNFAEFNINDEQKTALSSVGDDFTNDRLRGNENARYVFIEYSDLDCPFCGRFHESMLEVISNRNDVAWVYRHFPLEQIHPNARYVANVSECVAEYRNDQAFWDYIDNHFNS